MIPRFVSLSATALLAAAAALSPLGCKPKPQGAKIAPRVEKAAEKMFSPSSDAWVDVLKEPEKLALQNGAAINGGVLRLTSRSTASFRDSAGQNDGAIRLIAQQEPSEPGVTISARTQDTGARYTLTVKSETTVRLGQMLGTGEEMPLKDFSLPNPLPPGKPYELELRVVGSTLTAKLNGATLGEVTENSLTSGMMSVGLDVANAVMLGALQYLPLGNSVPVSTGATEQWINVLDSTEFLSKNTTIKKEDDGYAITGGASLLPKAARNCAVRMTLTNALKNSPLRITLRSSSAGSYNMNVRSNHGISVRRYDSETKGDVLLIEQPIPGTAPQGEDMELEFRAVGPRISVKINGEELQYAEDTKIKDGQISLGVYQKGVEEYGQPKLKKLEYAILDPAPGS